MKYATKCRVSFSFFPKGGAKWCCMDYWGDKYRSVCKTCGKLGGSGGMVPREILILDLLLDTIWWNLGLFLDKHNLRFIVSLGYNELAVRAHLFIIIFIDVYRKSEYITTVTNFASILANYFYFLRKITALRPSVLNFWSRLIEFCQKSSEQTVKKWLCWSRFTKNGTQNFM